MGEHQDSGLQTVGVTEGRLLLLHVNVSQLTDQLRDTREGGKKKSIVSPLTRWSRSGNEKLQPCLPAELRCYPSVVSWPLCCCEGQTRTPPSKPCPTLEGRDEINNSKWQLDWGFGRERLFNVVCCRVRGGELTLHVHVWRLVHEMHEELSGVDEDLVSAVADGAIPPGTLWQMGRKKWAGQEREVRGTAGTVGGRTTTTGRMTMKASPYTNSTCREKTTSKRWIPSKPRHVYQIKLFLN